VRKTICLTRNVAGRGSIIPLFLLDGKWRGMFLFLLGGNRIKTTLLPSDGKGATVMMKLSPKDGNKMKTTLLLPGG
jgi:hypothetical protein